MRRLASNATRLITTDRGASMIEYALLIVLIAIIAILAIQMAGNQISEAFSEVGSGLD